MFTKIIIPLAVGIMSGCTSTGGICDGISDPAADANCRMQAVQMFQQMSRNNMYTPPTVYTPPPRVYYPPAPSRAIQCRTTQTLGGFTTICN